MHRFVVRTCGYVATMCLLTLAACGDDEAEGGPSTSGSGGAGASGSAASTGSGGAGGSGDGGAGGDGVTACPELAGRVPMPELGPWMYGPHPGPCAQTDTSTDTGEVTSFVYEYDGQHLVGAVETRPSATFTHTFEYEGDRMVRMTQVGTGNPRVLDITYDDGARSITYGNDDYFVRYDLDDQGRPAHVTYDLFTDERPTITTEIVYDGCRLLRREQGVNPLDGTPSPSLPAFTYTFDGDLLVERDGETLRSVYDYSCW
ncbi:hypothetical protein WME90_17235 [Sorangium sp. So ce375]|uniref:hypothetical protein n=1 Tax=Sorangium sp. So ce375 TaxID=3133306 RepID=UPI003F5BDC89